MLANAHSSSLTPTTLGTGTGTEGAAADSDHRYGGDGVTFASLLSLEPLSPETSLVNISAAHHHLPRQHHHLPFSLGAATGTLTIGFPAAPVEYSIVHSSVLHSPTAREEQVQRLRTTMPFSTGYPENRKPPSPPHAATATAPAAVDEVSMPLTQAVAAGGGSGAAVGNTASAAPVRYPLSRKPATLGSGLIAHAHHLRERDGDRSEKRAATAEAKRDAVSTSAQVEESCARPHGPAPPKTQQRKKTPHGNGGGEKEGEALDAGPPLRDETTTTTTTTDLFAAVMYRNMFFLLLLGLINNFHYNLVISAASELASQYGMKRFVALISFCNVFLGMIARVLNTFAASRVSFNVRITIMSCLTMLGLLLVSYSRVIGRGVDVACFVVVLVGVTCVGTAYSYGETVALTFVQRYPPRMVGAWSAGTGISGVVASVLFVILSATGMDMVKIFLLSMPLTVIYWLVFTVGLVAPQKVAYVVFCGSINGDKTAPEGPKQGRRKKAFRRAKRVVLFRGREAEMLAGVRAQYSRDRNAFVTEPSTEMVINLLGISWRSVPAAAAVVSCSSKDGKARVEPPPRPRPWSDCKPSTVVSPGGPTADAGAALFSVSGCGLSLCSTPAEAEHGLAKGGDDAITRGVGALSGRDVDDAAFLYDVHQEAMAVLKARNAPPKRPQQHHQESADTAGGRRSGLAEDLDAKESSLPAEADTVAGGGGGGGVRSARYVEEKTDGRRRGCRKALLVPPPLQRWWHTHGGAIAAVHGAMWWLFANLAAVYMAEYAVQFMAPFAFYCTADWEQHRHERGGSDGGLSTMQTDDAAGLGKVSSPFKSSLFWLEYAYPLSQVCYQLGVLISRSSLILCGLKVTVVGVLSILQGINAVGWLVQAKTLFISSKHQLDVQVGLTFLLFAWIVFVGLLGGASYVNVFYLILTRSKAQQTEEEAVVLEVIRARQRERQRIHHRDSTSNTSGRREPCEGAANGAGSAVEAAALFDRRGCSGSGVFTNVVAGTREEREAAAAATAVIVGWEEGHPLQDAATEGPLEAAGGKPLRTAKPGTKDPSNAKGETATVDGELAENSSSSSDSDSSEDGMLAPAAGLRRTARMATIEVVSDRASDDGRSNDTLTIQSDERHHPRRIERRHHDPEGFSLDVNSHLYSASILSTAPREGAMSASSSSSFTDDAASLVKMTQEEARLLELYRSASAECWQRRRELAMSMGSLYAMLGICCGTIIDVFFTNTFMRTNNSSTCA